jgi:hypothetical protein
MKIKSTLFLLFFISSINTYSQKHFSKEIYFQSAFNKGFMLPEYDFINYYTQKNLTGFEIAVFKKTSGKSIWHKLYNYPELGFKYYFSTLGNKDIFGNIHAVYLFANLHIINKSKISFNCLTGLGGCYVTKKFDPENNFRNIAVGSKLNIFFHFDLNLHIKISPKFIFITGLNFNHFSNATLKQPNVGLNFGNSYTGLIYRIGEKSEHSDIDIPYFKSFSEKSIIIASGLKSSNIYNKKHAPTASLSINFTKNIFYKYACGIGIDLFYDSSMKKSIQKSDLIEFKNIYYFTSGIHFSNEVVINKLSIAIQIGAFILLKDHNKNKIIYNRAVIKYKINDFIFVNVALKTHLVVADFLEFGIGFNF